MAAGVSYRAYSLPWRDFAESQTKVVGFREQQLAELSQRAQRLASTAVQDEKAKFSDALRLLKNLGEAVEMEEGDERDSLLAEAIERAKSRIQEWTEEGR